MNRRVGVAFGSGSARGWAHLGVLHALEERGMQPVAVAGASVGALIAAAYASEQWRDLEAWVRTLTRVDVWRLLDTTFRGGGVMRGNRLMEAIGERIKDRQIDELPCAFAAVAADLNNGEEIWLREGSMLAAVRASSGLPGLFAPYWHQERWMIDGGVVNPVPVSLCRALGADYVIAVNLNVPVRERWQNRSDDTAVEAVGEDEPADEEGAEAGWPGFDKFGELLDGLVESLKPQPSREPGLFDVMAGSIHIMQDQIARSRMAEDPPDLEISPSLGHLQLMDFHLAAETIEVGYRAACRALDGLQPGGSSAGEEQA
ncbi:MAG: patatin-like phospholipase family protein [Steroidobacteraceae bacterium]